MNDDLSKGYSYSPFEKEGPGYHVMGVGSLFIDLLFSLSRSSCARMDLKSGGGGGDLLTARARGWGWGSALRSSIFKKKNIKMSMHRLGCR